MLLLSFALAINVIVIIGCDFAFKVYFILL